MFRKNKYRTYTVYCDSCQDFFDTIEDQIVEAWEDAKKAGWKTLVEENGTRAHYCPECWEQMNEG